MPRHFGVTPNPLRHPGDPNQDSPRLSLLGLHLGEAQLSGRRFVEHVEPARFPWFWVGIVSIMAGLCAAVWVLERGVAG